MELKKYLWLWGQSAGTHHECENNIWNLPGENKMTPMEGAKYFGIPNMCRVVMGNKPAPPFDKDAEELLACEKVVWSIIGDDSSDRTSKGVDDLDEVLRLAKKFPNITGGIMDDFMRPSRMAVYTPEVLKGFKDKLHSAGLDFWTVLYEHEIIPKAVPYLNQCDNISLWTWMGDNLKHLEENCKKLREMLLGGQKLYMGCYMWDYGASKPLSLSNMEYQLELYKKWLKEGVISGIILCSNCIADVGIEAVDFTKKWIDENSEI